MTRLLLVLALGSGIGLAPQAPQTAPKPPATQTAPGLRPGSIDLTVTSQTGGLLADATVRVEGPSSRQGSTNPEGEVILTNLAAGTYRCRIERTGYITLEKEIVVKAASRAAAEASLSTAPPPPAAPTPPPAPKEATPTLVPGQPVAVSLTDQLANDLMTSKDPIAEHALGCSGATAAKLIRLKDKLAAHTHGDADEFLYMIAGEATLTLGGKDQAVGPGWLGLVPRGMTHALTPKNNKTILLVLSIQSGPPCSNNTGHGAQ